MTLTEVAVTHHGLDDPIAKAVMATRITGPTVEITVDGDRYVLHHWTITDTPLRPPTCTCTCGGQQEYLQAVWTRRAEILEQFGQVPITYFGPVQRKDRLKTFAQQLLYAIKNR